MKTTPIVTTILATLFASLALAQEERTSSAAPFQNATIEQTEESLAQALKSDSPGLQISAAVTVRELKLYVFPSRSFSKLVIPLMAIVKNEEGESCARVIAALALHDLHSAFGDYAIKQMQTFAGCEKMKRACALLVQSRYEETHPQASGEVPPATALR